MEYLNFKVREHIFLTHLNRYVWLIERSGLEHIGIRIKDKSEEEKMINVRTL